MPIFCKKVGFMKILSDKEKYTTYYEKQCSQCGKTYFAKAKNQLRCDECRQKVRICIKCGTILTQKGKRICDKCREEAKRPRYHKKCEQCGAEFETGRGYQRYCSSECSKAAIAAVREERICIVCGKKYISTNKKQKYCSRRCKKRFNGTSNKYNRLLSSDQRLRIATNVDKTVWLMPLIKRDNNICALCGKPCDLYDYEITDIGTMITGENYPSIDHIIPLSKGGLHRWDNVQLAHRSCNRMKGND